MVVLQFASMRLSFSRNMPDMGDNPMAQSQRSMMYVMPLMFIFSGAFFQMGVVIYTVTASFWALAQSFWTIKVMPTPRLPGLRRPPRLARGRLPGVGQALLPELRP